MTAKTVETSTVRLYMAGDIQRAKELLRQECYPPNEGLCVTVEPTTFIYTGGEESGFVVGFVNYPRFPTTPAALFQRAHHIAERLIVGLCQWSALLVAPDKTVWINARPEDKQPQELKACDLRNGDRFHTKDYGGQVFRMTDRRIGASLACINEYNDNEHHVPADYPVTRAK